MKELIKITEQDGKQAVNARELHQFLIKDAKGGQQGRDFSEWIKEKLDFLEAEHGKDYVFLEYDYRGNPIPKNGESNTQQVRVHKRDYALTIDLAKEISMVQNNDKGKQARRYFIEVEKKYTNPMTQIELMQMSLNILAEQQKKTQQLETRIVKIEAKPEVNGEIQHFSILGYCRNIGKQISLNDAKLYGIKCSRLCSQMGFQTGKVPDPRFGTVKTYPLSVLEEIIN